MFVMNNGSLMVGPVLNEDFIIAAGCVILTNASLHFRVHASATLIVPIHMKFDRYVFMTFFSELIQKVTAREKIY